MYDMEHNISLSSKTQDTTFLECVIKAAELTHTLYLGKIKSAKAYNAMYTQDKKLKWIILQEYLQKYKSFINSLTCISGIYIFNVDLDFYNSVTELQLNEQLKIVVGFVYLNEALHSVEKETYKNCLKKLLKKSGIFSDTEISIL